MFDKLDDLLVRFEELLNELGEPGVTDDPAHFQKLMKEQSDLQPIVDAYKEYKKNKETIEDSLSMLESEKDEEMREMLKEELSDARKRVEELEHELKILLLPKDPNDSKNVIVEIRGGAGGDEAALFAAEIYRMYVKYAESRRWKTEMLSLNENGIGGFKEVTFMIKGEGAYSRLKYESGVHRVQRVPETEFILPPVLWPSCLKQKRLISIWISMNVNSMCSVLPETVVSVSILQTPRYVLPISLQES